MRVGIIALLQETNTFVPGKTTLRHFSADLLLSGEAVRDRLEPAPHEVGGFFAGLASEGMEAVPLFAARAVPHGIMAPECRVELFARLNTAFDEAGPLDGVLAAPHGATVAADDLDMDGTWLSMVRSRLGPDRPLVATFDAHANLSPTAFAACDALIGYRTNPHLDQKDRGLEAARLIARTLRSEIRPVTAAVFLPLAMNIDRQSTAEPPLSELGALADGIRSRPGVLSVSLLLGFPYADVPQMGASVAVVTHDNRALAQQCAAELAAAWWDRRAECDGRLLGPTDAVARAATAPGPVCLLDMGDNVGGGSPGDGTTLPFELIRQQVGPAFACFHDPESVSMAQAVGIGHVVELRAGGKTDPSLGESLSVRGVVRGLFDGRFTETQPRHGGATHFDQGPTAVVECDGGLTLMLTSRRVAPFSLSQLTTFGVNPSSYRVLVAKGVHAPVAAYAPVCPTLLRVDTPGPTAANLQRFEYRHRRRPMFPFEPNCEWMQQAGDGA